MAEKGKKTQAGEAKKRTVLQLQPVSYSITLVYLGEKYIKRSKNTYRCKYELQDEAGNSQESPPVWIHSPFFLENTNTTNAATPQEHFADADKKKSLATPFLDTVYKLMITDNHTLPEIHARLLGNTGNPNGDKLSRVSYYKRNDRKWMRDVIPAAPFRVIVRKFLGDGAQREQVDMEENLRVVLEVKDPVEEFSRHAPPAKVKGFLKDFFEKYNQSSSKPDPGDDNAPKCFKGLRDESAKTTGVKASKVINKLPYVKPPTANTPKPGNGVVAFSRLKKLKNYKKMLVRLDLKIDKLKDRDQEIKVGIADFAFRPLPIGGDQYRFLLSLFNKSGKDIRQTKANGADVKLLDESKNVLPKDPMLLSYCTGRFVIWRRVDVRLYFRANRLAANDVNWATVQSYYRHAFVELGDPILTKRLPRNAWRQSLRTLFRTASNTAQFNNNANFVGPAGDRDREYKKGLFPAFLQPGKKNSHVKRWAQYVLKRNIKKLHRPEAPEFKNLSARDRNIKQAGEGIYVLYVKANPASGGLLGSWMGDGKWMLCDHRGSPNVNETSETTTHEMGHGFFLRHAHTTSQRYWKIVGGNWQATNFTVTYRAAGAAAVTALNLYDAISNCFPEDHDQEYAFKCTMSYLQEEQFCGICALTLRFYDRIQIQKATRFQNRTMKGFFPAKIVQMTRPGANQIELRETIASVARGGRIDIMAVGPLNNFTVFGPPGTARSGRLNISCAHKNPNSLWSTSNPRVTVATRGAGSKYYARVSVAATAATGNCTITYTRNGQSATSNITVT